jgi:(R)-2-hydroxyacyl-CoA dehydratese activating ATPase
LIEGEDMRKIGVDLGSRAVKIVVFDNGSMVDSMIFDTAFFYRKYGICKDGKFYVDFDKLSFNKNDDFVATGYGRNNLNISNAKVINELKAHILGAIFQTNKTDFLLLDVGGQDSKVVDVAKGKIQDLKLNDKCAASCGRYLENMANVLGIGVEEMSRHFTNPVELSSTCAVFGESELIGKISEGYSIEELSAGVNYSLFRRILPLIEQFSRDTLILTGGVAGNEAIVEFIRIEMGFSEIIIPKYNQLNGAIGCAIS